MGAGEDGELGKRLMCANALCQTQVRRVDCGVACWAGTWSVRAHTVGIGMSVALSCRGGEGFLKSRPNSAFFPASGIDAVQRHNSRGQWQWRALRSVQIHAVYIQGSTHPALHQLELTEVECYDVQERYRLIDCKRLPSQPKAKS